MLYSSLILKISVLKIINIPISAIRFINPVSSIHLKDNFFNEKSFKYSAPLLSEDKMRKACLKPVSYTHLTLPTILLV